MRSQHLIVQELESLRNEVEQLRVHQQQSRQALEPEQFFHLANGGASFPATGIVSPLQANRVKKLTKFFGDEPPLLRLFLKNLGYEKYAAIFEDAKIGLLELPYVAEDRLEKLGIPLGPRIRILQESRVAASATHGPLVASHQHQQQQGDAPNYNVYIL
jgi:SAM domain (Sterile alpha motif)